VSLPLPPSDPDDIRRVAFLGTPQIAVPTLVALCDAGYEVPLVVSGADKRRGRGRDTSPTPVKVVALERGLAVVTAVDELLEVHHTNPIDLAVVVAFGKIIRPNVLAEIPMVNIHFSALPRWRGAAPVERAILEGDTTTAIAIMTVSEGLDEGDVWAQVPVPIDPSATVESLWNEMSVQGAQLLIDLMARGFLTHEPQVGEVRHAHKLTSEDLRLDWNRPASELHRIVRVGDAWTTLDGGRFKIHAAAIVDSVLPPGEIEDGVVGTSDGGIELITVQPAGKPRMAAEAWANGARPNGKVFGV
jgi:methionyl-tRNA formyltransferase